MRDAEIAHEKLRALRAPLGVRFAIDDFGTGYSCLSYIRRFPINTLKINKSFVSDAVNIQEDAEIVRTVVTMAHSLKLQVVAEGVETREALRFPRAIGCDAMQGNYFSRPLPPDEITKLLRAGKCLEADECGLMRASGADGGSEIPRR